MLLRYIAHSETDALLGRQSPDVARVKAHCAPAQRQLADNRLHQRCLAGAIAAEHGNSAAPWHSHVNAEQHLTAAVAGVKVDHIQELFVRHGANKPLELWGLLVSPAQTPSR